MSPCRFNVTKASNDLNAESATKKIKEKHEHHEQKKHNVLNTVFDEAASFWNGSDVFGKQELIGQFLEPDLSQLIGGFTHGFDFN